MQYHFAPLQGYTDAVFRETHAKHFKGIDAYYTPFCRVEKGEMRWHDQKDINPERNPTLFKEGRLVPQIIGNSAEEVTLLIQKIQEFGYKKVDVNFGCPFPMIAKKQKGAGILTCPEKVEEVLAALSQFSGMEFSLKMRLGMVAPDEALQLLPLINQTKLSHLTMHARLGKDQYKGEMDLESYETFAKACKIPLVFNGDITTLEGMQNIEEQYPNLSAMMIGRGLLQNPLLVEERINNAPYPAAKRNALLKSFLEELEAGYAEQMNGGEGQVVQKLTSYWEYLLPELDHKSRKKILKSKKMTDYKSGVTEALRATSK
ncbi:MAG: tRNA-dihydrouridine synthase family protein [Paludibacteraceae bacterium]|nr:tRNA-dihydrouridine synthase family protein [Paludibacteraceae bacterium]